MAKKESTIENIWSQDLKYLWDSIRVEVLEEMEKRGIASIPITAEREVTK